MARISHPTLVALLALSMLIAGCSSTATRMTDEVEQIAERQARVEPGASTSVDLFECMQRAATLGPAFTQAQLKSLLNRVQLDELSESGSLTASIGIAYGESIVDAGPGLRGSQAVRWDVFRYLQSRTLRSYRERNDRLEDALVDLAQREAALRAAQAYFDYLAAKQSREMIEQQLAALRKRAEVLSFAPRAAESIQIHRRKLLDQIEGLEREAISIETSEHTQRTNLIWLARLPAMVRIEANTPDIDNTEETTLDRYVSDVLSLSPDLDHAKLRAEVASTLADHARASRWTQFALELSFVDLFDTARLPIAAPIRWTLPLLDGGKHHRDVVRTRAEALLATLDLDRTFFETAQLATHVWFDRAEASIAYARTTRARHAAQISAWEVEQRSNSPEREEELAERRYALIETEGRMAAARTALHLAHMQYELLINPTFSAWLDRIGRPQ